MKDLYRCLDEHPKELLLGIAECWGIALPQDEPVRMVKRLGDAMQAPDAVASLVERLSDAARGALAVLAAQGGAAPARPLALRYGALRRLGPAGLRREKPWLSPTSPLEELYYRGLVYRAYGQVGEQVGDLLLVPPELLAALPPLEVPSLVRSTREHPQPAVAQASGQALLEDLLAVIVLLRRQPLAGLSHASPDGALLAHLAQGARLRGDAQAERLRLLWRLLIAQGLIEHDGRQWRPALGARQWLRRPDREQWLATFLAWRDDETWDELLHLPGIVCEPASCQHRPGQTRRRFCALLTHFPPGVWYELDSLVDALRAHHPDYLRPDGDLESWLIRDAESGAWLHGLASWHQVEGALARHLLTGPLHWLGIVDLGGEREGACAVRIPPAGARLLRGDLPEEPAVPPPDPLASVDAQLAIRIRVRDTRYHRYQLERLAEWEGQDDEHARYRLTEDSVWQSLNAGITVEQMVAFLQRITGGALPATVEASLRTWAARFGRVSLRRVVALETEDADTLQALYAEPELASLLGERLGPRLCLVSEDQLEALVAALKARGIWPRIRR